MSTKINYMYGKEAAFDMKTDVREPYWDYMARRGAGGESMKTTNEHSSTADAVNHPPHYNKGIETTKYIKSWDMNWNQANVIKYISRYNLKNKHDVNLQIQDLQKARWYLEDLIKELEKQNPY